MPLGSSFFYTDPMDDNIITYRTYSTLAEAAIARDILADAGIAASLAGELSTLYAPVPAPAGGVSLQIFERDLPRVAAILNPR